MMGDMKGDGIRVIAKVRVWVGFGVGPYGTRRSAALQGVMVALAIVSAVVRFKCMVRVRG